MTTSRAPVTSWSPPGGKALLEIHDNSRHEDTPGNGSVYVKAPWGMLIELQTIPGGHYYPEDSQSEVWMPSEPEQQG
ncbi:UNVERIFIED_CONTAM: hypothetical protein RF649_14800 [Kocuria sp. CPCC 205295]|uniref:hypothetical protein n=1 Tax=Kocuria TaxID=57493 RepID=UPI003648867F